MPLSKVKQAAYMKERRNQLKGVIPKSDGVIPKSMATQFKSSGIGEPLSTDVSPLVQPGVPKVWTDKEVGVLGYDPRKFLAAHISVCPDYNVDKPGNHFDHCRYVNAARGGRGRGVESCTSITITTTPKTNTQPPLLTRRTELAGYPKQRMV